MKRFIQLCEISRNEGIKFLRPGSKEPIIAKIDSRTEDWLEKCQPIVFTTGEMIVDQDTQEIGNSWGPAIDKIDAPFSHFSIEKVNGYLLQANDNEISEEFKILCVAVKEVGPKQFIFLSLIERSSDEKLMVCATNSESGLVSRFVQILNTQKVGVATTRSTVKFGSGSLKRIHRIRRIVYVSPKRDVEKISSEHKNIDWSHRWLVRGHWRSIPVGKLGKDRAGDYCITSFTWVTEFEKGPEAAPLISKTRLVVRS